jgi:hypothetical protein
LNHFIREIFSYRHGSHFQNLLAHRCAAVGAGGARNRPLPLVGPLVLPTTSSGAGYDTSSYGHAAETGEKGTPLFVTEVFYICSRKFCSMFLGFNYVK